MAEVRFARGSLIVLLLVAVALQPVSAAMAGVALKQLDQGADTLTIWSTYESGGGSDVVFVGDSRVRQDVDIAAISRQLSIDSGHRLTVGKIGLSNADAALVDAAVYRAVSTARKPRTVVIALSEFAFNASYQPDRTDDYWQLTSPPDIGYMRLALDHDWNRTRLLEGWAMPLVAQWPIVAEGLQCDIKTTPSCTYAATHLHLDHMSQEDYDLIRSYYLDMQLRNFKFSQLELDDLVSAAKRVHAVGARLAMVILPLNGIAELNPPMYRDYLGRMKSLATQVHAPLIDLHAAANTSDWSLWGDPSHLDDKGAAWFAPQLTSVVEVAT